MINVSYIMNVLNGEPFIQYQLDSLYQHAYEIVIVEGAYKKFKHAATPDGRSTDRTIEIINNFPDPQKKIKLVVQKGFYDDRLEMCDALLPHVTGNVIWQVDVDEFYYPETHLIIKNQFGADPALDRVSFCFYDIFASPKYYIEGHEAMGLDNVNRVHRFTSGDRWLNQRPPILGDRLGRQKVIRKHLDGYTIKEMGHVMFNGTALFEKQIREKYTYYSQMSRNISKPSRWVTEVWQDFSNKFNVAGFENSITYLKENKLDLPYGFKEMWNDILKGNYPGFHPRGIVDIENYFSSKESGEYEALAEKLIQLFHNFEMLKFISIKENMRLIKRISKLDSATRRHAIKFLIFSILRKIKHSVSN